MEVLPSSNPSASPLKKEGKMIEFLESFAKEYKIAIKKDEAGNLLMSKPATPGMEDRPVVVLQSHMDMVCEEKITVRNTISTMIRSRRSSTANGCVPTALLWEPIMVSV